MSRLAPTIDDSLEARRRVRTRIGPAFSLAAVLLTGGCTGTSAPAATTSTISATASGNPLGIASSAASASLAVLPSPAACPNAPGAAALDSEQIPAPDAPAGTIVKTVPAVGGPVSALVEDGSVWVADHREATVYRIDPATAVATRIAAEPALYFDHGGPLVPGLGGPWFGPFLTGSDVRGWVHIDAATNAASTPTGLRQALESLGAGGASSVAESADGLWAAASDVGTVDVAEFDRADGHELRRVTISGDASPGRAPRILLLAFGSLWETADGSQTIEQIDPVSGTVIGAVALPVAPVGMVAGDHAIYVATADASVARVDPTTDCVTAVQFLGGAATDPATGDGDLIAVAPGTDSVFVAYDRGALAVLDPTTLALRKAFRVDAQDFQGGVTAIAGTVWYPTFGNDTVLQVKP
jgi:hypothetical protein